MIIDRRKFIQHSALLAAAPALASLLSASLTAPATAAPRPDSLPRQPVSPDNDWNRAVFKIEGWDHSLDPAGDQMLIRITQAWKTAWR
jgi:hypothetical protein